jgi:hypothetical protein
MSALSGGATAILNQMYRYQLALNGDPAKDSPWFYVRLNPKAKPIKPTGSQDVDAPAARYCVELIEQKQIQLDSGSTEPKAGRYELTTEGRELGKTSN